MFAHAIQKAFLTSLDGISTIGALDASMMCSCDKIIITLFIIIYIKKELKTKVIDKKIDPPRHIHSASHTCYNKSI